MRHGGDIYGKNSGLIEMDFSVSLNPLGPPDGVRTAYLQAVSDLEHYPDPGCRRLREAVAGYENGHKAASAVPGAENGELGKDRIVCGNGASELFIAAGLALHKVSRRRKGGNISAFIPVPTYSGYEYAMRAAGVRTVFYEMRREENFCLTHRFLRTLESMAASGRELPDAVFVCTPNNPTGNCIAPELIEGLNDFSRKNEIFLFVDECYMALTASGAGGGVSAAQTGQFTCSARPYLYGNPYLVIFDAFTKTYAVPALRLGYALCGDPAFAGAMAACCSEWSVSVPAQAAGMAALMEKDYLKRAGEVISEERRYLAESLQKLGMTVFPGSANFLLFESDTELWQPLLERGILIRDCSGLRGLEGRDFSRSGAREVRKYYYRIGLRRHADNTRLVREIEKIL